MRWGSGSSLSFVDIRGLFHLCAASESVTWSQATRTARAFADCLLSSAPGGGPTYALLGTRPAASPYAVLNDSLARVVDVASPTADDARRPPALREVLPGGN
ncbi:MAG: hypothetical protein ACYDBQ_09690 [Thermoplasmatota archaeon]